MTEPGPSQAGVKGSVTIVELSRQERQAARRGAETRATVPSVELACPVDMGASLELAGTRGVRPLSVVLSFLALRLEEFPRLNGAYRDGRYELYSRINLGVSLPAQEGAVLGTLFDAAERTLEELDAELESLSSRATTGQLSAAELSGSTFTVVPPGPDGVTLLTPLVQPPQAATLAVGPWLQTPVVRSGELGVAWVARLTLACDHRIAPADSGAAFLAAVGRSLEAPAS